MEAGARLGVVVYASGPALYHYHPLHFPRYGKCFAQSVARNATDGELMRRGKKIIRHAAQVRGSK